MKSKLLTTTLVSSAILLLLVASLPMVFGYSSTTTTTPNGVLLTSGQQYLTTSSLTKVPVTLSFSPKTIDIAPGHVGKNTLAITNKGTKSITFTGCQLYVKPSSQTKYTRAMCTLGKVTVKPGQTLKLSWETGVSMSAPKGTYNLKVYLTNSADISAPGYFNVVIT